MTPEQRDNALEVLDGAHDMALATVREDGYPQATTVSFVHDGLTIYFATGTESQKARNIARSDKVSVAIALPYESWDQIRGISLGGRARVVIDPDESWRAFEAMLVCFPQIDSYADAMGAQEMCLMRVDPKIISLLDYRKGFGHTEEFRV